MELLKEILLEAIKNEEINISFSNLRMNAADIVGNECYKALEKIKAIIENDSLSDFECIEEIVCVFENIGSDGGSRHDFG